MMVAIYRVQPFSGAHRAIARLKLYKRGLIPQRRPNPSSEPPQISKSPLIAQNHTVKALGK